MQKGFIAIIIALVGTLILGIVIYKQLASDKFKAKNQIVLQEGFDPHSSPTPTANPTQLNKTSSPAFPTLTPIISPTPTPTKTSTPKPVPTQTSRTPTPSQPTSSPTLSSSYLVKPYLVYPADKPMYPEYESAIKTYLAELDEWYKGQVGKNLPLQSLQVVRSSYDYTTIRCGPAPSQECLNNPAKLDGNVGMYMNKAIHSGQEVWEAQTVALIFSAGAGGYAGANKYPNDTGWAIVGDWAIEPIAGRANDWGIPCRWSDGWQCSGGVPKGTPAHELGHAFGLPHPGRGPSIMHWHGDYPWAGFLQSEKDQLKNSPFFK